MFAIKNAVLVLLVLTVGTAAQVSTNKEAEEVKEIASTIRSRLDFYAQRNAEKWGNFVADECFCAGSTKKAIQLEISARPKSLENWYGEIQDLKVKFYGETAIAYYRTTEYSKLGDQQTKVEMWRTETFGHRADGWKLLAGCDRLILQAPPIAEIDSKIYDNYVGKYQYAPGETDTIIREGKRLFVKPENQPKEEIFPENETTFFAKGQDWRIIFVKNSKGKIRSLIFRQNGQDFVGKKLQQTQ